MTPVLAPKLATVTRKPPPKRWPLANRLPPMGALATVPATLRAHSATMLAVWGLRRLGTLDEDTRTVVSELATNAVQASQEPDGTPRYIGGEMPVVQFGLHSDLAVVVIEIYDMMPGEPKLQRPGDTLEAHGRGLALVDELSEEWGTRRDGRGKVVWARLRVSHGRL